jgi:hypothetical protein
VTCVGESVSATYCGVLDLAMGRAEPFRCCDVRLEAAECDDAVDMRDPDRREGAFETLDMRMEFRSVAKLPISPYSILVRNMLCTAALARRS